MTRGQDGSSASAETPPAPLGRERQRRRTRAALVATAAQMLRAGLEPTVTEAAEAADISRATAYRYFPSQEDLVSEAMLDLTLHGGDTPNSQSLVEEIAQLAATVVDHEERVGSIVALVAGWAFDNQVWLRRNLRSALHTKPDRPSYARPGHRLEWIELATGPMAPDVDAAEIARLRSALIVLIGVEAIIALADVGHYERNDIITTLEWTARALTVRACSAG